MPFEWTDADKARLKSGSTVTFCGEFSVEVVTLYAGGVWGSAQQPTLRIQHHFYVPLAACDPQTLMPPRSDG